MKRLFHFASTFLLLKYLVFWHFHFHPSLVGMFSICLQGPWYEESLIAGGVKNNVAATLVPWLCPISTLGPARPVSTTKTLFNWSISTSISPERSRSPWLAASPLCAHHHHHLLQDGDDHRHRPPPLHLHHHWCCLEALEAAGVLEDQLSHHQLAQFWELHVDRWMRLNGGHYLVL